MQTKLSLYCERVIEAGWLAAIVLVPVFFNIYSARTFEPDKITLMRSIALLMILAWLIKSVEVGIGQLGSSDASDESGKTQGMLQKMLDIPLFLPTLLVVLAYIISTAFSISPKVAMWGSYQRMQGTYTALSYIAIFALTASHLRTRAQLDRLMTVVIITSLPVGLYGVIQRYGLDPLPWAGDVQKRVASSLGNAIFVASFLIMAIPPTMARLLNSMRSIIDDEDAGWGNTILAAVYIFILAVDVIAVIFSMSRGPLLGLLAGTFFFILLALLAVYRLRQPGQEINVANGLRSLLETATPLVLGGILGILWYSILGPATLSSTGPLDVWAMAALGIVLGVAANILIIAIRVVLRQGQWRLWLNWVILAGLLAVFLVALNVPNTPFARFANVPFAGRVAELYEAGPGPSTTKVRMLIWEGVLNLISPHDALGIPGEFQDTYNSIRPLIGYGPESMFNSFAYVYPPELAHVEARGSSADRSHNETFDFIAMMGAFGFIAYYFLIFGLFYYLLKLVGWIRDAASRRLLLILLAIGGLLGIAVPPLLTGSFVFSGLGLPAGMLLMILVYLVWQAFTDKLPESEDGQKLVSSRHKDTGQALVAIGIFGALVGHLVEVHFVFSIAATYLYFWVFAGVVAAWVRGGLDQEQSTPVEASGDEADVVGDKAKGPNPSGSRASSKNRRRQRTKSGVAATRQGEKARVLQSGSQPTEDWETWLGAFGLVMAILMIAMIFDFVTAQFDIKRGNFSLVWIFSITWVMGLAVGLGEVAVRAKHWQKSISWGRALLLFVVTSVGYTAFYYLVHRWQLRPQDALMTDPIKAVMQGAGVVTTLFTVFYVFIGLLLLLIAAVLAIPVIQRAGRLRFASGWLNLIVIYPALIVATGLAISYKNMDVVRADMLLKQGEQYRNQRQYDYAIALHQRSVNLDPDEDFYYLMLALDYQLKAQDANTPAEARNQAWADGERIAQTARDINLYNPDNTGNMGRYYLTWAQVTPPEDPQQGARFEQAVAYFRKATDLAPQNVVYYNLLAQTYYILGQYEQAEELLQHSVSLDSLFDQTQMLLGDTYGAMGQPEEAIKAHRAAILMDPGAFADQFLDQRLNFYLSFPQMEDIISAFEEMMVEEPDSSLIPRTLGHIYSRMGDREKSIDYYLQAAHLGDNSEQTLLTIASEYLAAEDFVNAVSVYQLALDKNPDNAQAHSNLGYALARLGHVDEAIQENLKVLQLAPEDYISQRNLVLLYRDSGRVDEAIQQAEMMLTVTPENELGPGYLLLGDLYEMAERPTEAAEAYRMANSAEPQLLQAHSALGSIYLQEGKLEDALGSFETVAEMVPDDYAVHQQLALILQELRLMDRALEEAALALELAPEELKPALQQLVDEIVSQPAQGD